MHDLHAIGMDVTIRQSERCLIEAQQLRECSPKVWATAVWNWVNAEDGLGSVLWNRMIGWHLGGQAIWPKLHAPQGPCPLWARGPIQDTAAVEAFDELISRHVAKLLKVGIPPTWRQEGAPLALWITQMDVHVLHLQIHRIQRTLAGSGDAGGDDDDDEFSRVAAPASATGTATEPVSFRLQAEAKPATRPIQFAGLQLDPHLVWTDAPAPALRTILAEQVISVGRETGEALANLANAHRDSQTAYLELRHQIGERRERSLSLGNLAENWTKKLAHAEVLHLFLPLDRQVVCELTGWSEEAAWQTRSRYRTALEAGLVLSGLAPCWRDTVDESTDWNDDDATGETT